MSDEIKENIETSTEDVREHYEKPRIQSGQAFEKVLMGSGCNFNFNLSFQCNEPIENC